MDSGHTQNMIDYILVPGKWRNSVNNSRAYPSADIGSDHQLLITIRLKLKAMKSIAKMPRYDSAKLSDLLVADI